MKFDLHFHTTLSDGGKTPEQTVAIAKELGLEFLACTEHDIVNTRIPELARSVGIDAVEGVELSSSDYANNAKAAHLTCYSREFQGRIHSILDGVQQARCQKISLQVDKLRESGLLIEEDAFFAYWQSFGANLSNLNNGHLREYLLLNPRNYEILESIMGKAFERDTFIKQALSKTGEFAHIGSINNLPAYEPSVELCGQLAYENNAILSIAHANYTFRDIEEFKTLVPSYVERGVNALEIHLSTSPEWIEVLLETRKRFNLLLTFGSDCHFDSRKDGKHGMIGSLNPHVSQDFMDQEFRKFTRALELAV